MAQLDKTPPGFTRANNTALKQVKAVRSDRIDIEIGDSKQPDFKPQYKFMRWDNDVNFSIRAAEHPAATTDVVGNVTKYITPEHEVHMYEKPEMSDDGGFEFEWMLPSKPASNVLTATIETKNLRFAYQPPLTDEELADGATRPDNVIGSYAVYHSTKQNNRFEEAKDIAGLDIAQGLAEGWVKQENGKTYVMNHAIGTGKAFHIYRPKAIDANNTEAWCDLNIDENTGVLSVTVPQSFLDTAVYPVIVDPTFGYTTLGSSQTDIASGSGINNRSARRGRGEYDPGESGTLDTLHVGLISNTGTVTLDVTVFLNDEDSGGAGTHDEVASVERTSLAVNNTAAFYDFTAASESITSQNHVFSAWGDHTDLASSGELRLRFDSTTTSTTYFESGTYSSPEDPWTEVASTTSTSEYSIYATYTAAGGSRRVFNIA